MEFVEPIGASKAFTLAELFVASESEYTIYVKAVFAECKNKQLPREVVLTKSVEYEITAQTVQDCVETLEKYVDIYQIRELRVTCRHDTPEREGAYTCNIYPDERKVQLHGILPDGIFEIIYEYCCAHGVPTVQWCAW